MSRIATFSQFWRNLANLPLTTKPMKMATLEKITQNNKRTESVIASLRAELTAIRKEIIARKKKILQLENADLARKVEAARVQLIELELRNGKKQIALPGVRALSTDASVAGQQQVASTQSANETATTAASAAKDKTQKEKKPKKEKPAGDKVPAAAATELPVDIGRLDLRVGKIIEVGRHPDADSLYLEKIDCGEPQPRTVVSGLVKFVPLEEMQNRMVIVMCNLKPAKMRGVTSEAMVMCASTPEKVEVLSPPAGAVPGDLVHCEGYTRQPDAQLNPKKKIFETCAPDLKTNDVLIACYKGAALHVPGKGNIVAQTLKNVNVK